MKCYICHCKIEYGQPRVRIQKKIGNYIIKENPAHESCLRAAAAPKIETNIYDKEEIFTNCTVQVLTNTVTGDTSVGWWKEKEE